MKTFAKTACEEIVLGYELPDLKKIMFFSDLDICEDFGEDNL